MFESFRKKMFPRRHCQRLSSPWKHSYHFFGQYKSDCVFCHGRKGQDQNRSFRKFPLNNAELLQKWIATMAVKDFVPNKRIVLCSEHFEKDCFRKTGPNACTLTLKNIAIPTIFKLLLIDKTPAGEHHRNSPEEISAAYEGREKRRLSVDLPPPKTDTKYSMINSMRTSTSDSDKKQWQVQRTSRRIRHIVYDHRYETTPMREKMLLPEKRIQALMLEKHANNYQHISRLKQQVTSLKQIPYSSFQIVPTLIKL